MKVRLLATSGPMEGKVYELGEHETFLCGRSTNARCSLPDDPCVSRSHFVLEVNPPRVAVRDLGSHNGTYVNGKRLGETPGMGGGAARPAEALLGDGDEIGVGRTVLRCSFAGDRRCDRCGAIIPWDQEAASCDRAGTWRCASCREAAGHADAGDRATDALAEELVRKLMAASGMRDEHAPALRFHGYEMVKVLGSGGMGQVYLARNEHGEERAIKIIKPDHKITGEEVRRFRDRELPISLGMKHPNVVRYLEGDFVEGVYFLVMEYVEGCDIEGLMAEKGLLDVRLACGIVAKALDGLAYIHGRKVVHRDIKPRNILLTRGGLEPKISDFGLSKDRSLLGTMTRCGEIGGTAPFIAPDQIVDFKAAGPVADVFSMGATLYTMITGRHVCDFSPLKDPILVRLDPASIVPIRKRSPGIPAGVAEVVDRSIAFHPPERYQSAEEFRSALQRAVGKMAE